MDIKQVGSLIRAGGVGVFPTDTIYGLVGSAMEKDAVERLYSIKGRSGNKPFIILVRDKNDITRFGADINKEAIQLMEKYWPGELSIILPILSDDFKYLDCGTKTLAFRMPRNETLEDLLLETGPLVAPSANPQGEKPAETIAEARDYFGDSVDFYVEGDRLTGKASTIIDCTSEPYTVVRQGVVEL